MTYIRGFTVVQVTITTGNTCYLVAPSHYLNRYWLLTCENPQKSEHIWLKFQLRSTIESYNFKTAKLYIVVKSIPVYFILFQFLLWGENDRLIDTEWHIYASVHNAIIGSDNGLTPVQCQATIGTNAQLLLIGALWTSFRVTWIKIL